VILQLNINTIRVHFFKHGKLRKILLSTASTNSPVYECRELNFCLVNTAAVITRALMMMLLDAAIFGVGYDLMRTVPMLH
jgi:hypothetical protein